MASALLTILSEPAIYFLLTTAVTTVIYASFRANESLFKNRGGSHDHEHAPTLSQQVIDENTRMLEAPMAIAFPLIATVSILFLFFFLKSVGVVLTALSTISAFASITFLLWPFVEAIVRRFRTIGFVRRSNGLIELALAMPFALTIVVSWLLTGNWLSNNIIGIALCVIFASLCKVPNLKTCTVLFFGLFLYDIFFVFFSERFFGKNVMVEVATNTPTNPASVVANYLHLPIKPVKTLAMPAKLIIPAGERGDFILGLGDIILPEVFLVYLQEIDLRKRTDFGKGYFIRACFAYTLALLASFYFNQVFQVAQPALLYIVPAIILPSVIIAKLRGEMKVIWSGPDRGESHTESNLHQNDNQSEISPTQTTSLLTSKQADNAVTVS